MLDVICSYVYRAGPGLRIVPVEHRGVVLMAQYLQRPAFVGMVAIWARAVESVGLCVSPLMYSTINVQESSAARFASTYYTGICLIRRGT